MKKLIVISMVLAVVSVANAGVQWYCSYDAGTQTITAELVGEDILQFVLSNSGSAVKASVAGTFSDISINPGFTFASGTSAGTPFGQDVYIVQGLVDTTAGDPAVTGTLWSFKYVLDEPPAGMIYFEAPDNAFAKTADTQYSISDPCPLPEPMTFAFLALGGVFLRRMRRVN